jgi:RsiW-degrading membrane proteinase PrsW (M82 family)
VALVYRYDMYDREPAALLALTGVGGAAAMALLEAVEAALIPLLPPLGGAGPAAVAAVCEETAKLLVVAAIAVLARRHFNDPMDGVIYGSVAGLGAAVEESVAFLGDGTSGAWLPPGEIVRLLGHLVMGGIGCFGLGLVAGRRRGWPLALFGCWSAAVLLHFAWDWISLRPHALGAVSLPSVLAATLMVSGLLLYGALVASASARSRREFAPSSNGGLWGWPFRS